MFQVLLWKSKNLNIAILSLCTKNIQLDTNIIFKSCDPEQSCLHDFKIQQCSNSSADIFHRLGIICRKSRMLARVCFESSTEAIFKKNLVCCKSTYSSKSLPIQKKNWSKQLIFFFFFSFWFLKLSKKKDMAKVPKRHLPRDEIIFINFYLSFYFIYRIWIIPFLEFCT